MGLRSSSQIALTTGPVINPKNLKIEGFYCQDAARRKTILLFQDIRDVIPQGIVVNDLDALSDPHELVRLKDIVSLNFQLIGKQVVTTTKEKIGKVSDYATETQTFFIQKLYVAQSLFKSFTGGSIGIDRNQIVEITPQRIVIQGPESKEPVRAEAIASPS